MSTFEENDAVDGRLDYVALRDAGALLYYSRSVLDADLKWFRTERYVVHEFDCSAWTSEDDFHRAVAAQLDFPAYYGENLNAFNDCMRDVRVPSDGGIILLFLRVDVILGYAPNLVWNFVDILAGTTRRHLLHARRLLTLLQSDDPRVALNPVGGVPVLWNPKEWLNANRGV